MTRISHKRRRLPATVSQHAVWLCFGFTLSLRDIEELPAQRGVGVSYETVRCWASRVGPAAETCRRVGRWLIVDEVRTVTQHQSRLADDAGWGVSSTSSFAKARSSDVRLALGVRGDRLTHRLEQRFHRHRLHHHIVSAAREAGLTDIQ